MNIYRHSLYFIRIMLDLFVLVLSFFAAYYFATGEIKISLSTDDGFLLAGVITVWLLTAKNAGLYDDFRSRNFSFELALVIKNSFYLAAASIIILFVVKNETLSRLFVLYQSIILFTLISAEKYSIRRFLNYLRKKGRNLRTMLIVGAGQVGLNFYDAIVSNPHFGYHVKGFLDDKRSEELDGKYIGPISQLDNVLSKEQIDSVIVALPNYATEKLAEVIHVCERHTTRVKIIPNYFKFVSSKYNVSMFGPFPIVSVRGDRISEFHWNLLKRCFDIFFSAVVILFFLSWLMLLISILIKVTSKGKVFFEQERWGRNNKKFIAYKFRTMVNGSNDVDENGKYRQACKNDPRITRIGNFLRRTNLDELPQFFNVFFGDMSVVGPRPHPTPLNLESKSTIEHYMMRHLAKPGITGWAQVNGYRGETRDLSSMQKRIDHDIWYIENWSFLLDIQIIFLTIWRMMKGDLNAY